MATVYHSTEMFPVHRIPITRPFVWLGRARDDLRHAPAASLAFGWIVATLGALILAYSRHPLYIAAAVLFFATGNVVPDIQATVWGNVLSQLSAEQVTLYAPAFVALACTVFAVSVVTVPMMIDRHVDAGTAMRTILRAVARDWPALLLWSGLIVGLVLLGFSSWLIGMVVVVPLLAHATWDAYRDIVEEA